MRELKNVIKTAKRISIKKILKKMKVPTKFKTDLWNMHVDLEAQNLEKILDQILYIQPDAFEVLKNIRKGFYCYICDFNNHGFIDTKNKTMTLSRSSCEYLASNTVGYSYMVFNKLNENLIKYQKLLSNFDQMDNAITLPGIEDIQFDIK